MLPRRQVRHIGQGHRSISTSVMSAAKAAVEKAAARVAIASSDFMISPQGERRGNCVPS